ncbi:MAG: FMN-binding protein, partial [Planctomycetota bacterium]
MMRAVLLRVYRLGVLALMAWAVRERHARGREAEDRSVRLEEVRELFPQAARLSGRREEIHVLDREGRRLGTVLRSAPDSDAVRGYVGSTETLIAIGPDGRILAVRIRRSADSPEYVADIMEDPEFHSRWRGLTLEEAESLLESEGVSGATVTSRA